jgi:hypothetical protein
MIDRPRLISVQPTVCQAMFRYKCLSDRSCVLQNIFPEPQHLGTTWSYLICPCVSRFRLPTSGIGPRLPSPPSADAEPLRDNAVPIAHALFKPATFAGLSRRLRLRTTLSSLLPGTPSAYLLGAMKFHSLPAGFVIPAQPIKALNPPSGADWVHEIKHDGCRIIVRETAPL